MENNTIPISISELKQKKIPELMDMATSLNIENATSMKKQELIFSILQSQIEKIGTVYGAGVLEILPEWIWISKKP